LLCNAQSVSFFDAEPPREPAPEPEYRPPEWLQAPENYMPAAVALDALVVRRDDLAVWIADALVYPTGVELSVIIAHRYGSPPGRPHHPWFFHPGDLEGPRFGVGFADGRRGSTGGTPGRLDGPPDIVLTHNGGGGSDRRWNGRMWLWPLPPRGPLTFAFIWPDHGVEEAVLQLNSEPIRAGAERAVELWPDERPPQPPSDSGGWVAYGAS
jgi:hypothetical protein